MAALTSKTVVLDACGKLCYHCLMKKRGRIIPNGVVLETHENATVVFLADQGYDIELIPPVLTPNSKNADFIMDGIVWEMKSPLGKSVKTLEHLFIKATKQSENIVLDLRRMQKKDITKNMNVIRRLYRQTRSVRRLLVINKEGKLLTYFKK